MSIKITGAPCSWGVDNPKNPYLPTWLKVLDEASTAGYKGLELGPYGYIPIDLKLVEKELTDRHLTIVAGTIFDNLLAEENYENLKSQVHDICGLITKLPLEAKEEGQNFKTPYLVLIDWGHDERDFAAGHVGAAPRLSAADWKMMMDHIKGLAKIAWEEYGVRSVVHPHAGGYIEFADEIDKVVEDIPYEVAGLCLDTGHLYFSGMDPVEWLIKYQDRLDYVHFKDVNRTVYDDIIKEEIRFFDAVAKGVMCPLGTGSLDYPAIRQVLVDIGYNGFITIEQERDPRNSDTSLRDVKASLDYLRSIGF